MVESNKKITQEDIKKFDKAADEYDKKQLKEWGKISDELL